MRRTTYAHVDFLIDAALGRVARAQVVHDIVMEQTKTQQCSYAQHVMIQEATPQHLVEFGRATHYVSHAWRGSFEEMVAALGHWLQHDWDGQKDTVYFFLDVIACNHHVSVWGEGAHKLGPDQVGGLVEWEMRDVAEQQELETV